MTVSKSFTAVGTGPDLGVRPGESVSYSVSGTFVGTVIVEQAQRGGWTPLATITDAASGTLVIEAPGERFTRVHVRCEAFTSGTIVTSLTPSTSDVTGALYAADGSEVLQITTGGPVVPSDKTLRGVAAAGSDMQLQFNDGGAFGGSKHTYDKATVTTQFFTQLPAPDIAGLTAPVLAGAGAGNLSNGVYSYKFTLATPSGETDPSAATGSITVDDHTADGKVTVTLPNYSWANLPTALNVYRTAAGGSVYKFHSAQQFFGGTLTDNIADASLGAAAPTSNTAIEPSYGVTGDGALTAPYSSFVQGQSVLNLRAADSNGFVVQATEDPATISEITIYGEPGRLISSDNSAKITVASPDGLTLSTSAGSVQMDSTSISISVPPFAIGITSAGITLTGVPTTPGASGTLYLNSGVLTVSP